MVADKADFDGASALAALACAASLAQTTSCPTPATPATAQQLPVKQEQPSVVIPVSSAISAQTQASVKNEYDEVRITKGDLHYLTTSYSDESRGKKERS